MSTPPARLAANRRNALKSTGPKSAEGKAASRLNAFKHGMAGQGDLLAVGEDAAQVARRASAFVRELGATGEAGLILAQRAAVLSIRMQKSAEREMVAVAADVAEAMSRFDQELADDLARSVESFEGDDPRPAARELEQSPEGVAHLLAASAKLLDAIRRPDDPAKVKLAADRARLVLGLTVDDATSSLSDAEAADRIEAEMARLRVLTDSMTDYPQAVAEARDEAGILAGFNPSPEATLARRYEAAAERGMYRAFRAIAEHRKAQGHDGYPLEAATAAPTAPPHPNLNPDRTELSASNPASLGSFRAGALATTSRQIKSAWNLVEPAVSPEQPRKKRPDLRKLAASRR